MSKNEIDETEWTKIQPEKTITKLPLSFSIRKADSGKPHGKLVLSLSKEVIAEAGFKPGAELELRFNEEHYRFMLTLAKAPPYHHLLIAKSGRGTWTAVLTGSLGEQWAFQPCSNEPLEVLSCGNGQLIFKGPAYAEAETV